MGHWPDHDREDDITMTETTTSTATATEADELRDTITGLELKVLTLEGWASEWREVWQRERRLRERAEGWGLTVLERTQAALFAALALAEGEAMQGALDIALRDVDELAWEMPR